jgi:uncharacterized membrane protein
VSLPAAALSPIAVSPSNVAAPIRRSRLVAVGALLALVMLGLAWELWLAPTGSGTLAAKVLPLTLALPGLLALRLYTYRWLSLLVWLYVAEGLVRATSGGGITAALAWAEVGLGVALFTACALHVRWRLAHSTPAAPVAPDTTWTAPPC